MSVNLNNLLFPVVLSGGSCQLEPIHREKKYCISPLIHCIYKPFNKQECAEKNLRDARNLNTENVVVSEVLLES